MTTWFTKKENAPKIEAATKAVNDAVKKGDKPSASDAATVARMATQRGSRGDDARAAQKGRL